MKKLLLSIFLLTSYLANAQYTLKWAKTLGGNFLDQTRCAVETFDGGIMVAGYTYQSRKTLWILKLNKYGLEVFGKTFDEAKTGIPSAIIQLPDSGFMIAGTCDYKKTNNSDAWLLRINKQGTILWEKTYGKNTANEGITGLCKTADGGYAFCGFTDDNEFLQWDYWIMKLDAEGNRLWDQAYGGTKADFAHAILETPDNGLVTVGYASAKGGGFRNTYAVKLDSDGNLVWEQVYKKSTWDDGTAITYTQDSCMVIAGFTKAEGTINYDVRLTKIDGNGSIIWDKTYGGPEWEEATSITNTVGQGLAISAFSKSTSGEYDDFWTLYVDKYGELLWDQTYGGGGFDFACSILESKSKSLYVIGSTYTNEELGWDYAILKLDPEVSERNFRPKISIKIPADSFCIVSDTNMVDISLCIKTNDTLEYTHLLVNDSIILNNVHLKYSYNDSTCPLFANEKITLQEGRNSIRVETENYMGKAQTRNYNIYYLSPRRFRW